MGLDMYLFKTRINEEMDLKVWLELIFNLRTEDINDSTLLEYLKKYEYDDQNKEVGEKVLYLHIAYWRKANAIHNWIYENCAADRQEDYDLIIVCREKLLILHNLCLEVLRQKEIEGTSKVQIYEKLLPTKTGFFFGSTNYDDGYFSDIEETIKKIDKILNELADNEICFYYANY